MNHHYRMLSEAGAEVKKMLKKQKTAGKKDALSELLAECAPPPSAPKVTINNNAKWWIGDECTSELFQHPNFSVTALLLASKTSNEHRNPLLQLRCSTRFLFICISSNQYSTFSGKIRSCARLLHLVISSVSSEGDGEQQAVRLPLRPVLQVQSLVSFRSSLLKFKLKSVLWISLSGSGIVCVYLVCQ